VQNKTKKNSDQDKCVRRKWLSTHVKSQHITS